jgi:hypothetical protein
MSTTTMRFYQGETLLNEREAPCSISKSIDDLRRAGWRVASTVDHEELELLEVTMQLGNMEAVLTGVVVLDSNTKWGGFVNLNRLADVRGLVWKRHPVVHPKD